MTLIPKVMCLVNLKWEEKYFKKENYYIKSGLNGRVETFELSTINGSSIFA